MGRRGNQTVTYINQQMSATSMAHQCILQWAKMTGFYISATLSHQTQATPKKEVTSENVTSYS